MHTIAHVTQRSVELCQSSFGGGLRGGRRRVPRPMLNFAIVTIFLCSFAVVIFVCSRGMKSAPERGRWDRRRDCNQWLVQWKLNYNQSLLHRVVCLLSSLYSRNGAQHEKQIITSLKCGWLMRGEKFSSRRPSNIELTICVVIFRYFTVGELPSNFCINLGNFFIMKTTQWGFFGRRESKQLNSWKMQVVTKLAAVLLLYDDSMKTLSR